MRIVRVLPKSKTSMAAGLLGLLVMTSGCGSGSGGESNVAPTEPPPGASAAEVSAAYKQAYGPTGVPKPNKRIVRFKAR
jgi:hypothetical protein